VSELSLDDAQREEIRVVGDAEKMMWPNGCVGWEAPGMACTEALVEGYILDPLTGVLAFTAEQVTTSGGTLTTTTLDITLNPDGSGVITKHDANNILLGTMDIPAGSTTRVRTDRVIVTNTAEGTESQWLALGEVIYKGDVEFFNDAAALLLPFLESLLLSRSPEPQ